MAKLGIDFAKVEASTGQRPALPSGWQRGIIEESELKPTSNHAQTGNELINIKIKVIDGPYANNVLYKNFNYKNQNSQAQDIGWGEMKALNDALGIAQPDDTAEWHNKPFLFYVKYKPARIQPGVNGGPDKEFDEGNDINGFKNINDTTVSVNHNVMAKSGGVPVLTSGISGGSPVPAVGQQSGLAAVMAQAQPAAVPNVASAPIVAISTPAPVAPTPVQTPPSAPVAPPPAPVAPKVFELRMTAKANGSTAEAFRLSDPNWTDELLISQGYAEMVEVAPKLPAVPTAPAAPQIPPSPASTVSAPAVATGAAVPPWLAGKA